VINSPAGISAGRWKKTTASGFIFPGAADLIVARRMNVRLKRRDVDRLKE
jgi:hypothetical protein